jgi:hypothetical protein
MFLRNHEDLANFEFVPESSNILMKKAAKHPFKTTDFQGLHKNTANLHDLQNLIVIY